MREFLEEAVTHRDDGYGRAQQHAKNPLPKRFYKDVSVRDAGGTFGLALDGRAVKTPGARLEVLVPTRALAAALAAEWAAQDELIRAETMPLVRLVNSALESGEATVPAFRDEVVKYAAGDLLLYRAEHPRELVEEQERRWDGVLVALARRFGLSFQPTRGILHQAQPQKTLDRLPALVAGEGLLAMTALVSVTNLTGSGLLAIAVRHGLIGADEAWEVAHVDEDHQARLWGADEEAVLRRTKRRAEYDAALAVLGEIPVPAC